jgi:hypothetical protein
MKSRDDKDADLERDVLRALRAGGELIPVSDEEVLAAERELEDADVELPEGLQRYRGEPRLTGGAVVRRGPWLGYAGATLLGAAAASLLLLSRWPERPADVTSAGRDLVAPPSSSAPPDPRTLLSLQACSKDCCGGGDCPASPPALKACPSGQRCIACNAGQGDGPFRLRLGAMVLSEAGERLLEPARGTLLLCVTTPGADAICLPALSSGKTDDQWRLLDRVSSAQDLLSGLTVEVRREGEPLALAAWKHPVVAAPEVFCKGLAIQPRQGPDVVGRVSAFVEQTHFVELGRADSLAALKGRRGAFEFRGVTPRVYETSGSGGRFVLVLGPLDKQRAQSLRWAALEGGHEASVEFGLDFVGAPRPLP